MTHRDRKPTRDDVLWAFHQACSRPTAEEIIEWISRYPQFAEDIRAHAAVARDLDARKDLPSEEPSETMLEHAYSRALSALYKAEVEHPAPEKREVPRSFQQILAAREKDVPMLAREIGGDVEIKRSVVAALVNGTMRPPIGSRFRKAMTNALSITADVFDAALQMALAEPRLGHAKSDTPPTVNARSYEEIVRSSGMTLTQIQYWLDQK